MWTEKMDEILKSPAARRFVPQLSPIYGDAYTALWLFNVIGAMLDRVNNVTDSLADQALPQTVTWGIAYFEQDYGIISDESLPLETRRANLLTKIRTRAPLNPARVEKILSTLIGADVKLTENISKNRFQVSVKGDFGSDQKQALRDALDRMKPAHVIYLLVYIIELLVSEKENLKFVPVRFRFTGAVNSWMMEPVLLNGEKNLDGTWFLDQQIRRHFILRRLRIRTRLHEEAHISIRWPMQPMRLQERIDSHMRFSVRHEDKVETRLQNRATTFFVRVACPIKSSGKLIRDSRWYLDGTYNLNGTRRLHAELKEEVF
mgnify:FL=1